MSTTATFTVSGSALAFPGTVLRHRPARVELAADRDGTAGLDGEDEITMGRRGRYIDLVIRFQGFANDAALAAAIALWNSRIGMNGTLTLAGGITRTYTNVTLHQVDESGLPTTQSDPTLLRTQEVSVQFYDLNPV